MKHRQTNNGVIVGNGINGSLRKREVTQPQQHIEYYLFNSQGNLKAYSDDVMSFAYYGYNAANTRTYKISLYNTNLWINGQQQPLNLQWQNAMFYPNTYLNFNQNGEYTKHYYNGMERIASRLGDNNTTIAIDNMLENRKLLLEEQVRNDIQELISETPQVDLPPMLDILNLQPTGTPNDIYYYHPNHLGSTAFVTDNNATITQGFLYAPFGEITTEYNINFGNNVIPKYSFNAKELDEETGMYYYEARYYNLPMFISRDPHSERYFWTSPYGYCSNNPLKYVDPTGMDWYETEDGNIEWTDCKNQAEMNKEGIKGNYLGEAFMDIKGSRNEKLGTGNNLFTEGAVLAKATVYGPKGENDIQEYDAFTMSSDFSKYGAIADGNYNVSYRVPGKTGALKSNWAVNDTRPIDCLDGKNPNPGGYSSTQKNGIYIHRSNNDGSMLPKETPVSTGCIIIVPSRNGNNGWNEFNKQLSGVSAFTMRLKRD